MCILLIILIVIAVPLIIALFMDKGFVIERNIIINKPQQEVFDYIKLLRNTGNYNKWVMIDPNLKKEFEGTDGTVGAIYKWDSENKQVGKGEQEIIKLTDSRIDYELRFIKPFQNVANAYLIADSVAGNQTKVTWGFTGLRNFPMRIMHLLMNLKKMLGNDLQTSLGNLKILLEK